MARTDATQAPGNVLGRSSGPLNVGYLRMAVLCEEGAAFPASDDSRNEGCAGSLNLKGHSRGGQCIDAGTGDYRVI